MRFIGTSAVVASLMVASACSVKIGSSVPRTSASLVQELASVETAAWNAWRAKDGTFFTRQLLPTAKYVSASGLMTPAQLADATVKFTCSVGPITLDNFEAIPLTDDSALLIGKASYEYTCGSTKNSATSWFTTAFRRVDDRWMIAYHQEADVK